MDEARGALPPGAATPPATTSAPAPVEAPRDLLGPAGGPALLAIAIVGMAALTWRRLLDPIIDSGREVYSAWQVAEGARFGVDVLGVYGPLSSHVDALFLLLGGTSIRTLLLADLAVLVALVALLYRLVASAVGRDDATLVGLTVVSMFGFAAYGTAGYSWIGPYAHEATHGLLLAVATMCLLLRHARTGHLGAALGAGATWGLALLTKPEPAVAATAVVAAFLALGWRAAPALGLSRARTAASVAGGAALAVAVVLGLLALRLGAAKGVEVGLSAWSAVLRARVSSHPFYLAVTGLDDPAGNLEVTLVSTAGLLALFGLMCGVGLVGGRTGKAGVVVLLVLGALGLAVSGPQVSAALERFGRPLPLTTGALALLLVSRAHRASGERAAALEALPGALGATFALALLPKLGLCAEVGFYGFTLALPATALLVVGLRAAARRVPARLGGGPVLRGLVVAGLLGVCAWHVAWTARTCAAATFPLGRGADVIHTTPGRGEPLAAALAEIEARVPSGGAVAVLPEGAMLNFMARRRSPLRYVNCNPVDLATMSGEDAFFAPMRADPPDLVVLVGERTMREYGVRPFGEDARFGASTMAWIRREYDVVAVHHPSAGSPPPSGDVTIYERRATR